MDVKLWWFALQKPVKENDKRVWDSFDLVSKWLISTRATVTQLTLLAGVISGLLAFRDGFFNLPLWLAMTLGIYFAHSSENLVNDYIDFTRGIDEYATPQAFFAVRQFGLNQNQRRLYDAIHLFRIRWTRRSRSHGAP